MKELPLAFTTELKALGISTAAETEVCGYAQRNLRQIDELAGRAYEGDPPSFPICRLHPLGRLAVLIWKLPEIRRKYASLGVQNDVIQATFSDIALRQALFQAKTGKIGLSRADCVWLRHLVNAQIFKLGVLQFQLFSMFYLEQHADGSRLFFISDAQKAKLPAGSPVLNVHIQEGADLTPARVAESLQLAEDFFARNFPQTQFQAMVCYSWLLHPGLKALLPPESKILRFAENFEVVAEAADDTQAVERIFGRRFQRKADYPQETRLQRAALRESQKLGYALGVKYLG